MLSMPSTLLCIAALHSCKVALASLSLTYNRHTGQLIFPTPRCSANFKRSDWCYCIESGFKGVFKEREKKALLERNNTVVKCIDFPVLLLLCGCKQYGSRHTCPCGKVDGTQLTEGDYKTQGLCAIKDKSVLKVIMMESRRLNVT